MMNRNIDGEPEFEAYDNDADYADTPSFDSPSEDAPIQRTSYDEPQYDGEPEFDAYDNVADYADTPSFDSPPVDAPIQRTSYDEPQFNDYDTDSNYAEMTDPTVTNSDVTNTPIQRQELEESDDLDMSPAEVNDGPPPESLSISKPTESRPSQSSPVQRQSQDSSSNTPEAASNHPDLGDGGDYQDFGDSTWSDLNEVPPATSIQREASDDNFDTLDNTSLLDNASVEPSIQRDAYDEPKFDEYGDSDLDFGDASSFDSPSAESPIQRESYDEPQFDEYGDSDVDFGNASSFDSPSAESPIQRESYDEPQFDEYGDIDVDFGNASSFDSPSAESPIQRESYDEPQFDEYGDNELDLGDVGPSDSLSINPPVQRRTDDEPQFDEYYDNDIDLGDVGPSDSLSINPPVQRRTDDEPQFDEYSDNELGDFSGELSIGTNESSIQRQPTSQNTDQSNDSQDQYLDDSANDYEDYGDATWAEMNDYSPVNDNSPSDVPIQRDALPTFDDDFDGLQDTDGMTAMNILSDYIAERGQSETTPANDNNTPIQRSYQDDDSYDYLPDDFDPTPEIYDFSNADNGSDAIANTDSIQRSEVGFDDAEIPDQQPMDLFSALAQEGAVKRRESNSTPSDSIQRENLESDEPESYDDYGDMTWAEMNDYSPASDNVTSDTPIQRTPADYDAHESYADDSQPMDLFSALAQEGRVQKRDAGHENSTPIQRNASQTPHGNGLDPNMADLYNAMMESGMIQQSDGFDYNGTGTSDTPIQREEQPEPQHQPVDIGEALRQASQVSPTSGVRSSESSKTSHDVNLANGISHTIQREGENDMGSGTASGTEDVSSASIEGEDEQGNTSQEDKSYLDQLARDVFRVIKRRLREENERRG